MDTKSSIRSQERGQGLVEYALILILVSVAAVLVLVLPGEQIQGMFCGLVRTFDESAADSIAACGIPPLTCSVTDTSPGSINVEALVDTEEVGPITQVEFFVDGTSIRFEYEVHYCLGGGNSACNDYSLGSGTHTIRAVASNGIRSVGECMVVVSVP